MHPCMFTILPSLDCTNITFQSWFQNLMGRQFGMPRAPSLSSSNYGDAQAQELPSTAKDATTFYENSELHVRK